MDRANLEQALIAAHNAGNAEHARILADALANQSLPPVDAPLPPTPQDDTGFFGNLAKGIGAGFVGTGEYAALGAATLLEEQEELAAREKIQSIAKSYMPEGGDPDAGIYKLGQALGSIAGTVVPAVGAAAIAPGGLPALIAGGATAGAIGIGAGSGEASERARAAGATLEERNVAARWGAGIGATEALLPVKLLTRGSKLGKLLQEADVPAESFEQGLKNAVITGGVEGVQEFTTSLAQDAVERGYNPDRDYEFGEAFEEGGYGALAGAIVQSVSDGVVKRVKGKRSTEIRDEDIDDIGTPTTEATDAPPEQAIVDAVKDSLSPLERQAMEAAEANDEARFENLARRIELERQAAEAADNGDEAAFERITRALEFEERKAEDPSIEQREKYGPPAGPLVSPLERARLEHNQAQEAKRKGGEERQATEQRRAELLQQTIEENSDNDAKTISRKFKQRLASEDVADTAPTQSEMQTIRRAVDFARAEPITPATTPDSAQLGAMEARVRGRPDSPQATLPGVKELRREQEDVKPKPEEPAQTPDIITEERLNELGIRQSALVRKAVINKDLNQPNIQQRLRNFAESPKAGSKQARANVARLLEDLSGGQRDLFTSAPTIKAGVPDGGAGRPQQSPSRVGVQDTVSDVGKESGVLAGESNTGVTVAPEGTGVADARGRTRKPVRGKTDELPALNRIDQQLLNLIQDKENPLSDEDFFALRGRLVMNMYGDVDQRVTDAFVAESERRRETTVPAPEGEAVTPKKVKTKGKKAKAPAKTEAETETEIEEVTEFGGFSLREDAQTTEEQQALREARAKQAAAQKAKKKAEVEDKKKAEARVAQEKKSAQDKEKEAKKKAEEKAEANPKLIDTLDDETRAAVEADIEYLQEAEQLRAPRIREIPESEDPVTASDIKKIAAMIKLARVRGRKETQKVAKLIEKYLATPERIIDGIAEAIYEDVSEAKNYRSPVERDKDGKTVKDKNDEPIYLDSKATREYMQGHSAANARIVLAWIKVNGSKKLNDWIDGRRARVQNLENKSVAHILRVLKEADQIKGTTTKIEARQIRKYVRGEIDDTTAEIIERAIEADTARKQIAKEKAEQEAADEVIADEISRIIDIGDIETIDDDMPYELRTGSVLDGDVHPAALSALKDGDLAGALSILAMSPDTRVSRIARALADNIGNTKVEVFFDTKKDSLAGFFDPQTNTVNLNEAYGISEHTLLHEMVHAATSATLAKKSDPITKQLTTLYNDVKDMLGTAYGTKNLDEFVSEAMSNPEFQAELATLHPKGSKINGLQRFFNSVGNLIRRMLGQDAKNIDTALTRADALIHEILAPAPEFRDANILAMASLSDDVKLVAKKLGDIQKSLGKSSGQSRTKFIDNLYDFMSESSDKLRSGVMYFMDLQTIGDLADRYSNKLGTIASDINTAIKESKGAQEKAQEFVRKRVAKVDRWAYKNRDKVENLNNIIQSQEYGATIYQVDPHKDRKDYEGKFDEDSGIELAEIWDKQQTDWEALGEDGRKIFDVMRDTYKKINGDLRAVLEGQIDAAVGQDSDTAKRMKNEVFANLFDGQMLEVYFPLMREGKYKLEFTYKPGKAPEGSDSYVFLMFHSKAERNRLLKELKNDDNILEVHSFDGDIAKQRYEQRPANSFVRDVLKVLDASNANDETKDQIVRLFISALPETSFAKSLQKRRNVEGYEMNAIRVFNVRGYELARQVEQLRFTAKLQNLAGQMYERDIEPKKEKDSTALNITRNALQDHINFAQRGAMFKGFERIIRNATQTAFLYTIGFNAASTVVNLSQVPLVAYPMLGGRYGFPDAERELYRASNFVTRARKFREEPPDGATPTQKADFYVNSASIGYGIDAYYDVDSEGNFSVRKDLKDKKLIAEAKRNLPLVQRMKREAELSRSYLLDVLGMHEGSKTVKGGFIEGLGRIKNTAVAGSAMMFNQAERFNRQTITVAAYNLELEKLSQQYPDMPFNDRAELAVEEALYQAQELAGGNILETAPRLAQQNLGRSALMYKTFGLRMYTTMFKAAYRLVKNSFLAAVRSGVPRKQAAREAYVALKQLTALHGSAFFFAGVYGLPLYGAVSLTYRLMDEFGLRELFMEAFDDEDDETIGSPEAYNDFNTIVRDHIGEGYFKGPLNVILDELGAGVDVASRVRLTGLLVQENKFNPDANFDEMVMYYLGGAPLSVAKRVGNGAKMIAEGEVERGMELVVPAAVSSGLKAMRYSEEGRIQNKRGNPIYDDLTSGEIAAQVFGFAPAEYVRITEENQNMARIDKAMQNKRSKLLKKYYKALSQGSIDDVLDVHDEIDRFNARNPSFALSHTTIRNSVRSNIAADVEMEFYNGVRLSPQMKRAIEANRAGVEDTLIPPK
jgi:hypothetical protein